MSDTDKVTVFGAGKSGVAAANFLAARGFSVIVTDSAEESRIPLAGRIDPRVRRFFGGHPDETVRDAGLIVLSPGVPLSLPVLREASERNIPIISEIELAFRHLKGTVVAITGSNGKSTTTALIGEILKAADRDPVVAGNIGDPLVGAVDPERPRTYVIELSSFQLETVQSFHADVALLLNITPDHMDRYDSIDDYAASKYRIFRNQTARDVSVVNADDPRTFDPPTSARVLRFSSVRQAGAGAWLDGDSLVLGTGGRTIRIPRENLAIAGTANVENALASWLACDALGCDLDAVESAFRSFQGLPHRMVSVRELDGVRWVNDSKGTNVDATVKSLEGMQDGRVLLILGGKDKQGEFERLRDLASRKTRAVLTIGSAAPRITEALEGKVELVGCVDMARAVAWAQAHAGAGDTVLLSPACASFDQYRNFEHRGEHFEELVRSLESRNAGSGA